jgi:hypothetical protein
MSKKEGNQTVTDCHGFKMQAPDGKMRKTDCADAEPQMNTDKHGLGMARELRKVRKNNWEKISRCSCVFEITKRGEI